MIHIEQAIQAFGDTLDGWIEGARANHDALEHRQRIEECCLTFAPDDIRRMIQDTRRELAARVPATGSGLGMTPRHLPAHVCGALHAASRGRRPCPGRIYTSSGAVAVTLASDARPWAVATGGAPGRHGHPIHMVRRVFLAWKAGRPVGMLVHAECGSKLLTAGLHWQYQLYGRRRCVRCPAIKRSRELAQADRDLLVRSQ